MESTITVPDYLNKDVFKIVLGRSLENKNFQIKDMRFKMGSSPGDNYCSEIYQATVTYHQNGEEKVVSFIAKTIPINKSNEVLVTNNVFEKERSVYSNVLSYVEREIKIAKIGPKFYHSITDPVRTFFFEDLKAIGYDNQDREKGLDEDHARMALHKLGLFHAGSILYNKQNPQLTDMYWHGMLRRDVMKDPLYVSVFVHNLKQCIAMVRTWPGYEAIARKLEKYQENFVDIMLKNVEPTPDEIKVLNHGDFWVNNMMFRHDPKDQNVVTDVIFVDFQYSFFTSPGIDLNYFLSSSVQLDVIKHNRDELISTYYEAFSTTLKKFNYEPVPTEEEVRHEIRRKELYGLMTATTVFPIMVFDRKESHDNSLEALADEEVSQRKREIMYRSPKVIEYLKYTLKRFDDLNVLDVD